MGRLERAQLRGDNDLTNFQSAFYARKVWWEENVGLRERILCLSLVLN